MPRRDLPLLKCDLCPMTTKNHYIFKKHRQRCVRENKLALAQQSAIASQGQEDVDGENYVEVLEDDGKNVIEPDSLANSEEATQSLEAGKVASTGKRTLRQGNQSKPVKSEDSRDCEESMETDEYSVGGEEKASTSFSSGDLLPLYTCRNYSCDLCSYTTNKPKEFLYHKIEQHKARIYVFSCVVCEYASQYKHKLIRHMKHAHHVIHKNNEIQPDNLSFKPGEDRRGKVAPVSHKPHGSKGSKGHRGGRSKKALSSKVSLKGNQSLDSLLVKLRSKTRITEASLSSFFTSAAGTGGQLGGEEGAGGCEDELYKCRLCLFTGKSKTKVIRHLQACHVNARLFRCHLCSFKTYSKIEFYAHKKKHTNKHSTMFKCKECSYATEFRPNFERHMIQHGSNKPNKCSLCSYATDHEGALKRHVTSHHPNTEENQSLIIAGDDGGKTLSSDNNDNDDLSGAEESEERLDSDGFSCPICSSKYRRCSDLNRHMKSKHNVSRKDFLEHNGNNSEEEIFELDDETFEEEVDIEEMLESDEDEYEEEVPLSELHLKGKATAKKINKKCSHCSYIAKWPSDLSRHMRVHSVVKRFKCSLCAKKYKYLGDLNVHMRRDHEVNPEQQTPQKISTIATKKNSPRLFRCPACPFYTKVKVHMDYHSQKHTEEKTYSCKLCSYQTYWRGDMGRHLYRKHPQEVSKEADVKEFFVYRHERRAISKGGKGVPLHETAATGTKEDDDGQEAAAAARGKGPRKASPEKLVVGGDRNEDSPPSDWMSTGSEVLKVDRHGNRLYQCQLCPFSTLLSNKLKCHMDTHTNLRPFQCPVCGQRGNWKYDIRKHMRAKHPSSRLAVITLTMEEAKATIEGYLESRPVLRRGHDLCLPQAGSASAPSPKTKGKGKAVRRKAYEYKCSHCSFRSLYRWSVSKHQRRNHQNQAGIGILAKKISVPDQPPPGGEEREESAQEGQREELDEQGEEGMQASASQSDNKSVEKQASADQEQQDREKHKQGLVKQEEVSDDKSTASHRGTQLDSVAPSHDHNTRRSTSDQQDGHDRPAAEATEEEEGGSTLLYGCAECKKQGTSIGAIKKHYNYIHSLSEVRIVSLVDGVEFNYYTGLPTVKPESPAPGPPPAPAAADMMDPSIASKLSDPKKHGYVRPFKCSVCGQRSNWKWDIKKHLRQKHPDDFGYVIVLQLDQARATLAETKKHSPMKDPESRSSLSTSAETEARNSLSGGGGDNDSFEVPEMPYKSQEMLLGRYRRYKCSGCGYRSNWRTDICRHISRRHRDGSAAVIFMGVEEAKDTFMAYHYNPPNASAHTPGVAPGSSFRRLLTQRGSGSRLQGSKPSKKAAPMTGKVWHCPKCPFVSANMSQIVGHMQDHGMKPFHCSVCGLTSRYRSPMYRHIRKQHNSRNYSAFTKIFIKFSKPSALASLKGGGLPAQFEFAYLCRLCSSNPVETATEEEMRNHLLTDHGSTDASQALKIKKKIVAKEGDDADQSTGDSKGEREKRYFCTICPYRSDKRGMLTFHHAYHQPSAENKYKCRLCPYYVCAPRLLHQHMKWHQEPPRFAQTPVDPAAVPTWRAAAEKTPPSSPSKRGVRAAPETPKRHSCEKCPYTTNSKNDFLYHKQFHRPKPAAEYKCEHCDYWVTHRRLLKQHSRLHGNQYSPAESLPSNSASPTKSLASDASAVMDAVEIAAIKQKMIANKITASLSTSPAVSPMKIATQCSAGNRPGFILRNGAYKKLHQCRKCPYTNVRSRNVRLHEMMHGWRSSPHPLMKCPHCDYYVGAKGLLSHHMKVHLRQYRQDPLDSTVFDLERREKVPGGAGFTADLPDDSASNVFASPDIPQKFKVDTLLEISRFKKYSCEKCPYASGKHAHFLRHMELHGSRQRHTCQYCDYSVPSVTLLQQHQRIHLLPNQNLLATQSFSNLQHLKEVPADVALASALPPTDSGEPVSISVIHDHLELYENDDSIGGGGPRKLYRCDRCPYANVRRDHLLTHLRFHLTSSAFPCPYCDYSAPKQQLLTQHIRVHFCPLPELSEWLIENGQNERAQEINDIDLTQALKVAEKYQSSAKRKLNSEIMANQKKRENGVAAGEDSKEPAAKKVKIEEAPKAKTEEAPKESSITPGEEKDSSKEPSLNKDTMSECKDQVEPKPSTSSAADEAEKMADDREARENGKAGEEGESTVYICQYCDREFSSSKLLIAHELQHLIGNHFELADDSSCDAEPVEKSEPSKETTQGKEDRQHVTSAEVKATKQMEEGEESAVQKSGKREDGPAPEAESGEAKAEAEVETKMDTSEDGMLREDVGAVCVKDGTSSEETDMVVGKGEEEKGGVEEGSGEKSQPVAEDKDLNARRTESKDTGGEKKDADAEKKDAAEGKEDVGAEEKTVGAEKAEEKDGKEEKTDLNLEKTDPSTETKDQDEVGGSDRRYMMRRRVENNSSSSAGTDSDTAGKQGAGQKEVVQNGDK